MKHEPTKTVLPQGRTSCGTLATELGKQVARILTLDASRVGARTRGARNLRQDALWDCAGVLQLAGRVPDTDALLTKLGTLPAVLAQSDQTGFPASLSGWVAQTRLLVADAARSQ